MTGLPRWNTYSFLTYYCPVKPTFKMSINTCTEVTTMPVPFNYYRRYPSIGTCTEVATAIIPKQRCNIVPFVSTYTIYNSAIAFSSVLSGFLIEVLTTTISIYGREVAQRIVRRLSIRLTYFTFALFFFNCFFIILSISAMARFWDALKSAFSL